jgi:hypothetical protein
LQARERLIMILGVSKLGGDIGSPETLSRDAV